MVKFFIKLAIAGGLIYWLISQGKMDFSLLAKSLNHPMNWVICFACLFINIFLGAFRWKNILQLKTNSVFNYFNILRISWIGLLFNTVLPGSVSGDFIKLVYAKDLDKGFDKTFLVTSVIMDRIMGLFGLLTILGISSIYNYSELTAKSPELKNLVHFNFLIFFGIILVIVSVLLPPKYQELIIKFISKFPKTVAKHAIKALQQVWLIGENRKVLFTNIGISMVGQTFFMLGFYMLCKPFFDAEIPFRYALTFIPLGLCTIAIPITPQGLGVGHAAFATLFKYFGISTGASLFNLYFLSAVLSNLVGVFPYLMSGKKSLKDAQEFES